jgi:glutamate-ammonia-ligase adenylyltransferase
LQADAFDLKQSLGGIIDVEFLVQYLVLRHAPQHPELTDNIGNIGLLKRLAALGIVDAGLAESVAVAYREYRHTQHMLKLQGAAKISVPLDAMAVHAKNVKALWAQVFDF